METYYATATKYAKSLNQTLTVGNAGVTVPSSFIGTVDNIVIYEDASTPPLALLNSYTGYAPVCRVKSFRLLVKSDRFRRLYSATNKQ